MWLTQETRNMLFGGKIVRGPPCSCRTGTQVEAFGPVFSARWSKVTFAVAPFSRYSLLENQTNFRVFSSVFLNSNKTDQRSKFAVFLGVLSALQVGTYNELLQNEGAFSEFLKTFAAEQNAEEEGLLYLLTVLCHIFVLYLSLCITVCTNVWDASP